MTPLPAAVQLGPPLLTVGEVAAFLQCSPEMVYKLRKRKRLPAVKVGAVYRWRPEVVRSFVSSQED